MNHASQINRSHITIVYIKYDNVSVSVSLYYIRETRQYRRAPTTMDSDGRGGVLQRIRINRNVVAVSKIRDTMVSLCSTIINTVSLIQFLYGGDLTGKRFTTLPNVPARGPRFLLLRNHLGSRRVAISRGSGGKSGSDEAFVAGEK